MNDFEETQDVQELSDRVFADTIMAMVQNLEDDIIPPDLAERLAKSAANVAVAAMRYRPKVNEGWEEMADFDENKKE